MVKEVEIMKKDIHPEYQKVIFLDTGSNYKFLSGSTRTSDEMMEWEDGNEYPVIRVEISGRKNRSLQEKVQHEVKLICKEIKNIVTRKNQAKMPVFYLFKMEIDTRSS